MNKFIILFSVLSVTLLSACSDEQEPQSSAATAVKQKPTAVNAQGMRHPLAKITEPPKREYGFADVTAGARLYHENCTSCHGPHGEGGRKPAAPGKAVAPPLNGTGHAWHHPMIGLTQTILHGTVSQGGAMPAWKGKLNEQQIGQIIAWMQSRWSDEIYATWLLTDKKARRPQPKR